MKKILFAVLVLWTQLSYGQGSLSNDIPLSAAGIPPPNRGRVWLDVSTSKLWGRLPDGSVKDFSIRPTINGKTGINISLVPSDLGIVNDSISPKTTISPLLAQKGYMLSATQARSTLLTTLPPSIIYISSGLFYPGSFQYDPNDTTTLDDGKMCIVTGNGKRFKRLIEGNIVDVRWFGALGTANDSPTLQAAVDWVKALLLNGGPARYTVMVPLGSYLLKTPINCTYTNGLWISGVQGRYLKSSLFGETNGIILDFTGSSSSGCSSLQFYTSSPTGSNTPSTIGVMFGLGVTNGLYTGISDCWFDMHTNAAANGGMGTICVLNIRSEETYVRECMLKGNSPLVFSNTSTLTTRNAAVTFTSSFGAGLATGGSGSMGVIDVTGTTINAYDHVGHGITSYGTNALRFHGYIHGEYHSGSVGNEFAAIGFYNSNLSNSLSGTIEGYPTAIFMGTDAKLNGSTVQFNLANLVVNTEPGVYVSAGVGGLPTAFVNCRIGVVYANGTAEQSGRYFVYTPPVNGGNSPATAYATDTDFISPAFSDITKFMSMNLIRNLNGRCRLVSGQPSTSENDWITLDVKLPRTFATQGNLVGVFGTNVARFLQCDKATTTSGNAGRYIVRIKGVMRVGDYNSTNQLTAEFESFITVQQQADGTKQTTKSETYVRNQVTSSSSYSYLTSITANVVFSGPFGIIQITPVFTGTGTSETVTYTGDVSIFADFAVNKTLIFD